MTKEIPLTRGLVALVDDEDYDAVMAAGKWYADVVRGGPLTYAAHNVYRGSVRLGIERLHTLITGQSYVDHRNGNGLDNRRANLRPATNVQNVRNCGIRSDNTSGYKGVSWRKDIAAWRAYIQVYGKQRSLGSFTTPEEAARVRDAAALELHGEFARLNFPSNDECEATA